ncbi:hypothetical protein B296_00033756 [Ensete ventricosum]|uniref:GDSL esterase/lipase n=1 Tax=Ensete ventricosum TaxID=4639 RepID=A0A427A6D2_ENSVE|nr:hypothetical protein B296_00033756 [Ensete ventricosum]
MYELVFNVGSNSYGVQKKPTTVSGSGEQNPPAHPKRPPRRELCLRRVRNPRLHCELSSSHQLIYFPYAMGYPNILIFIFQGTTITMTKQIQDFAAHRSNIASRVTAVVAKGLLSKSVFLISSGGNDVFAFFFGTSGNATADQIEQFYNVMITNYTTHLKALYDLGARKFALVNVPPVGCCPISRVRHPLGACLDGLNGLAKGFNDRVSALMKNLSSEMEGMKYTIGNSYNVVMSIVSDPAGVGYKDASSACCGSGKLGAEVMCSPNTTYCTNRNEFLFWDRIHPTHATAGKAGFAMYSGALEYASPINLKQLVAI